MAGGYPSSILTRPQSQSPCKCKHPPGTLFVTSEQEELAQRAFVEVAQPDDGGLDYNPFCGERGGVVGGTRFSSVCVRMGCDTVSRM